MVKYKYIVTSGCSFVQSSKDRDEPNRRTHDPKLVSREGYKPAFVDFLAEKMNLPFYNLAIGGTGIRYAIYSLLDWIQKNKDKSKDTLFICGITTFARFEFINRELGLRDKEGFWGRLDIMDKSEDKYHDTLYRLPKDNYKRWYWENIYNDKEVEFELRGLIEMFSSYLRVNNHRCIFINTLNDNIYAETAIDISDICELFYFPNNTPYWREHILSDDNTYKLAHPNKHDHMVLADLLYDYINI